MLLDCWVSILMILVIAGHGMFDFAPSWYVRLHTWIYSFHMGAFYFAAGFLVHLNCRPINSWHDYWCYEKKKLMKFGIPFVFLGVLGSALAVWQRHGGVSDFRHALFLLFAAPSASKVIYLWFIYVLFLFYLFAPVFCQYCRSHSWLLLLGSILLSQLPLPHWLAGNCFAKFLVFFIAGTIAQKYWEKTTRFLGAISIITIPVFLYCSIFQAGKLPYLCSGFLALPCLYWLCKLFMTCGNAWTNNCYTLISMNCFSIYLYQMIFLNLLALLWKRLPAPSSCFILFLLLGIVLSIAGSILFAFLLRKLSCRCKMFCA